MKYKIISLLRSLGVLKHADTLKYAVQRLRVAARNRQFQQRYPAFAVPPHDLAFDAYNHCDWHAYRDSGLRHAGIFARVIREYEGSEPVAILEWGCGPGRLIRHLPQLLNGRASILVGADYNLRSVQWCRQNLPGIDFVHNELMPPLPFPDNSFDVAYCFSVFTHLSEEAQTAWARELRRVLKPGGMMICTTHGDNYRYLLTGNDEKRCFDHGGVVIQGRYTEGKKWYFAIHPAQFVRDVLLKDFADAQQLKATEADQLLQDVWVARKPEVYESSVIEGCHPLTHTR